MNTQSVHANPIKNRSPRHRAREYAIQGLYEWLLNKNDCSAIDIINHISQAFGFDKADTGHFKTLVTGVITQSQELNEEILPHIGRKISELSPVEHAILLLGAYELRNHIEIPYRVVINESVELAKSFGGIDGHKFVNGVLDKIAAKLRATEFDVVHSKN